MSVSVGIRIKEQVMQVFQDMKARSLHRFVIFKMTPDFQSVEIEYPPEPTPVLKLATHMVNQALKKHRQEEGQHSPTTHHRDDGEDHHADMANSIGPELAVLPPEIFTHVLKFCPVDTLWSLSSVSKYWNERISYDKELWQAIRDQERTKLGMGWNQSWEDMVKKLPPDDCRFVVFMWERSENRFQPLYIIWAPETSRVKTKMIYCSSAYPLKKTLDLAAEVQATSYDEITYEEVADTLRRTYGYSPA